ncbi:chitin synthase III catalytic subunit [Boletus reticuloceps]|uniref:Chitin synthase III catalytic subunit n=1 Tax=Boletus reticuloceps TaxID=495285 RepID=A0A8I2YYV1_9AGAM|nr:chitin synthase III catalytic subunit [Boletus reticuloceps]KAG6379483.1 chitin synthase III catalytic subunit [Boletus reticuloceps]
MHFGDFSTLCSQVPSYTWCNLFYRQVLDSDRSLLTGLSANPAMAPVGVNPECGIPLVQTDGSLGNVANIIACGLSVFVVVGLIVFSTRRKAAVGRSELRIFFGLYLLTLVFQILTTGSVLEQGSKGLVILTAIHAGLVATLFWTLLGNAIVATQVVEDGTLSSLIPFGIISLFFFVATTYISLDTAFSLSKAFGPSNPQQALNGIPLFVLTSIWPGVAALVYFGIMLYIVVGVLNEVRPVWYYVISAILFVLSQLDYFLLNKVICRGSSMKVDGSFIATILETAAVVCLYLAWRGITEEDWDVEYYPS